MEVFLNRVDGIDDAILSMFYSKRHMDRETEMKVRRTVQCCSTNIYNPPVAKGAIIMGDRDLDDWMSKMLNFSLKHITLAKFIDLSFTVYGLHRGGQDDWDSHAKRFDNRIIRESTRLGDFQQGEMSEWYQDKIVPTDLALAYLGIVLPTKIEANGNTYVKATNGYILEGHENDKDYKRGLYMLSIPSNFIFRINLSEFGHVYQNRNELGGANPEVKIACESMADQTIHAFHGYITRDWLMNIKN